jgi:hypothetical protein
MRFFKCVLSLLLLCGIDQSGLLAAPAVSFDGRSLSLTVENQSFGQVMSLLQQQTGLQFEIPSDLQSLRLPLVDINQLSVRQALLKLLQGSNYDYILVAAPGDPDMIQKLLVLGKSSKISAAPSAFKGANRPAVEDPFGGGIDTTFEDNQTESPVVNTQPAQPQPAANAPIQGIAPVQPGLQGQPGVQPQPGIQPTTVNPTQPLPPGTFIPQQQQQQQQQTQPQGLQPFNPFNQNNRRSPY